VADNVTITAGTGTTIAADEVVDATLGTVKAQYVKIMDGTLGGTNKVTVKGASTAAAATDPALVVAISPNGVNANGQTTMLNSAPVVIASNQSTLPAGLVPVTSGGCTIKSVLIASGTNATNVKASAGQLYKIEILNNSANIAYLKVYNTAGTPTAGSGTPVIRLMVPGSASGSGIVSEYVNGLAFSTGIGFTFTGGIPDADTTSVAASAYILNLYYA
jgi:hypothetical protein